MTREQQDALNKAVLYALREGCFFPVPEPRAPYRMRDLIKWGAMRNLHTAIADAFGEQPSPQTSGRRKAR